MIVHKKRVEPWKITLVDTGIDFWYDKAWRRAKKTYWCISLVEYGLELYY